ncbi:MAG: hypothetical protein NC410_11585 [Oscillibacter sp.]|nr:hypothetical protein [Oscillibacter sp.]
MKTALLILLVLGCLCTTTEVQAQRKRAYIPLKEFGNDTLAFLMKNFNYADDYRPYHWERNLKTFIKEDIEKDLPIKAFRIINADDCPTFDFGLIEFYYHTPQQIIEKDKKGIQAFCIQISIYLQKTDPLCQEMIKAGINLEEKLMTWDDKYLEILNLLDIELFNVNKYYKNTADIPWPQGYIFLYEDDIWDEWD